MANKDIKDLEIIPSINQDDMLVGERTPGQTRLIAFRMDVLNVGYELVNQPYSGFVNAAGGYLVNGTSVYYPGGVAAGISTAVSIPDGGTGRSTATAYGVLVGGTTATGAHQSVANGTVTGQVLQYSGTSSLPTYSTATYPSASGTSGKFLVSNGTNNIYSTSTIPTSAGSTALKHLRSDGTNYVLSTVTFSDTPGTAGKVMMSDGTNWIASVVTFPNSVPTAGKILISDGTNWIASTFTYPTTAGTSGKRVTSDGTNLVMSTTTMPDTGTTGKFIIGNGTNYVESTSTIPTSAGATALKYLRSDGTNYILSTATISDTPSTAGKILISDGTNWTTSTPTYPSAATSRKIIVGNGTNYVESTETWPVPGTSGKVMQSDGTNWTSVTPNGTGLPVGTTSPALVTPVLGAATATSINFGGTTFNTYTEGTWTPTFTFATPGNLSMAYVLQQGTYTKVGNLVIIEFALQCTPTYTTASSFIMIGGLPFTPQASNGAGCFVPVSAITFPAGCTAMYLTSAGGTSMYLKGYGTGVAQTAFTIAQAPTTVSFYISGSFSYRV